jgi:hypothetical protein
MLRSRYKYPKAPHHMYHNLRVFPSLRCHSHSMKPYNLLARYAICSITIALVSCQSAQELIDAVLNPPPGSSRYASYGSEIYMNHTLYNTTPIAPTNYDRLEASAKLLLPPAAYDYAAGGAGLEKTVAANRNAFDKVSLTYPGYLQTRILTYPNSGAYSHA